MIFDYFTSMPVIRNGVQLNKNCLSIDKIDKQLIGKICTIIMNCLNAVISSLILCVYLKHFNRFSKFKMLSDLQVKNVIASVET